MNERLHLSLPPKWWPWKSYKLQSYNSFSIPAKVYNALFFNHIRPVRNVWWIMQMIFGEPFPHLGFWQFVEYKGVNTKCSRGNTFVVDFTIYRVKIEQMLLAYALPTKKKNCLRSNDALKNMKVMVWLTDKDAVFFILSVAFCKDVN